MLITLEQLEDDPVPFDEVFPAGLIDYVEVGIRQVEPLQVQGIASAIEREWLPVELIASARSVNS